MTLYILAGMTELGIAQNQMKMEVGLYVEVSAHLVLIIFRRKLHRSIEKCSDYPGNGNGATTILHV